MAKCKSCGRRGLFLKLQNGLCSPCFDRLLPADRMPFGLTRDMFLNPDKYVKEPEPLARNTSAEIPGFVTASDGSKIQIDSLPNFYVFSGIRIIDSNLYEITSATNIQRAKRDILSLNSYLDRAKQLCKTFPDDRFVETKLKFVFDPHIYTRDYCTLSFTPLTKTGRVASCPLKLFAPQGEFFHTDILYGSDGEIARAEISTLKVTRTRTTTGIRQDCTSHSVTLVKQDDELRIRFIYRNDSGRRNKVYDSKSV